MKFFLAIAFILLITNSAFSQKQNNHWYFGFNAGLDFTSGTPVPVEGSLKAFEGCASVSDPNGNLLFYTNGLSVWNRDHQVMPNGSFLAGGISSTQAALILPLPGSDNIYYLFTTEDQASDGGMHYSIIDMALDGGLGDYMNDDILNGVSSLDLIIIQKHLLGITPFRSIHDYIAADINKSGNVSAVDLIELRKVLLGINTQFPHNTSWRFGVLPPDLGIADITQFNETGLCTKNRSATCVIDFTGIKIGDLTGDAQPKK